MYVIMVHMKLSRKIEQAVVLVGLSTMILVFGILMKLNPISPQRTFADSGEKVVVNEDTNFVTFHDDKEKLTIKTNAKTVEAALMAAGIVINKGDKVEPGLETEINADNFYINIYRARPVIIRDGAVEKYLMSASYNTREIFDEAGVTVYDGDEISAAPNLNFLEAGVATVYEISRNGGRTVTVEEEIPFGEETVKDYNLAVGSSEVRQIGEVGTKRVSYNVLYIDNVEASREVIAEEVVRTPVNRVVAIGAKTAVRPEQETCAGWARAAGVSEAELSVALDLIYRESGCRVNATNPSSGAYGIPQALPGRKMAEMGADWETNPVTQIKWMIKYVNGRYGGWVQALEFWHGHGWY